MPETKDISAQLDELAGKKREALKGAEAILQRTGPDKPMSDDEAKEVREAEDRAQTYQDQMGVLERQLELTGDDKRSKPEDRSRRGKSGPLDTEPGGENRGTDDDGEVRFKCADGEHRTLDEIQSEERDKIECLAYRMWMSGGYGNLGHQMQTVLDTLAVDGMRDQDIKGLQRELAGYGITDTRALQAGSAAAGGYTIPEGFYRVMTKAQLHFAAMERAGATVMNTESGEDIPMPTVDDTGNEGEIVGETSQVASQDVAFGSKTMGSFMYSSKLVRVQIQLLNDSAFNLQDWLGNLLGERIGRVFNKHTTTGNGTTQPEGLITAANTGKTTAANTAITYDEMVDFDESIDESYLQDDEAMLMFNQNTLGVLRKLKDSDGRPIWEPAAQGRPARINGRRYIINNHMANIGASAKPIAFGLFKYYHVRKVRRPALFRFQEKYMDYLQVGFLGYQRLDGLLLDPGATAAASPVKVLAMPA